jgi:DNA-binding IclR family transcriptional regulator
MPRRTPYTITDPDEFLNELEAIRQRGYGIDNNERSMSIRCVAVPIRDGENKVIAALSVAGPSERMPNPLLGSEVAQLALETAEQISRELGMPASAPNGFHNQSRR